MSKRQLNSLFIFLIVLACGITVLTFFVWNDPRSHEVDESAQAMTRVHIDHCELGEKRNKVEIKGWGYVEKHPHGFFQVYGQTDNGQYRKFETFSRKRGDVANNLKLDEVYELMGFKASYRSLSSNYTGKIMILRVNPQGDVFSAHYKCS